jgi:hypothetical protein
MADTATFHMGAEKSASTISAKKNRILLVFLLSSIPIIAFNTYLLKQTDILYICLAAVLSISAILFFYIRNLTDHLAQHIWNSYQLEVNSTGVIETTDRPRFSEFSNQISWSTSRQVIRWDNMVLEESKRTILIDTRNSSKLSRALFGEGAIIIHDEIHNRENLLELIRYYLHNQHKDANNRALDS